MAEEKRELTPEELDETAGGGMYYDDNQRIVNARLQLIGTHDLVHDILYYVPCDKCQKPMHNGVIGWYCTPCDRHLWFVNRYVWNGTKEALKAASL